MKKIFGLMLLCATMVGFASCEKSEEDVTNYPSIIGTWYQLVGNSNGDYLSMDTEVYWIFRADNTAIEKLDIKMNGSSIKTQTLNFSYVYKGTYIDFKKNDGSSFRYNVSVNGNKMRLGNEESGYFDLTKKY